MGKAEKNSELVLLWSFCLWCAFALFLLFSPSTISRLWNLLIMNMEKDWSLSCLADSLYSYSTWYCFVMEYNYNLCLLPVTIFKAQNISYSQFSGKTIKKKSPIMFMGSHFFGWIRQSLVPCIGVSLWKSVSVSLWHPDQMVPGEIATLTLCDKEVWCVDSLQWNHLQQDARRSSSQVNPHTVCGRLLRFSSTSQSF